jgi:hypothetical protein
MGPEDLKRASDEFDASLTIAERKIEREYEEARARGDVEGEKAALAKYSRMVEIMEEFLSWLRF